MLLVDTYLDRSPIAGIGVFARHAIAEGTVVWAYHPAVDIAHTPADWEAFLSQLSAPVQADMRRHSYKQGGRIVLCLDNGRFMNHAEATANVENDGATDTMHARYDIPAGAELLCDYRQYSDPDDAHLLSVTGAR